MSSDRSDDSNEPPGSHAPDGSDDEQAGSDPQVGSDELAGSGASRSSDPTREQSVAAVGPEGETPDEDEWWADRHIVYWAREPMLRALLLVVLVHFAIFIASTLLAAIRTAHPVGVVISVLLIAVTALGVRAEIRRKGRPAGLTWMMLATWLMSVVVAYAGDHLGLL